MKKAMEEHLKCAIEYVRNNKTWGEYREKNAIKEMEEVGCDLYLADSDLCNEIYNLMEEYTEDNDLTKFWWAELTDEDEIFKKL